MIGMLSKANNLAKTPDRFRRCRRALVQVISQNAAGPPPLRPNSPLGLWVIGLSKEVH
jgi:hypothetical protein